MLAIGFGASLCRAIDTLPPQRLFPQTGGAVQQITDRHSRGRTRIRFDRAPEMLREMIGIAERCQLRLDQPLGAQLFPIGEHEIGDMMSERVRSEEHNSEIQSIMRISYAVFCLNIKKHTT